MKTAGTAVAGVGVYLPPPAGRVARSPIGADRHGVSNRVKAGQGISTPSLAAGAARAALRAAAVPVEEIQLIVVGTTSPDVLWPTTACLVQVELGLPMVGALDLYAGEAGLLTALNVGHHYITAGSRAVLVIGAESDNQLVDLPGQPRPHGRAASAVVLRRVAGDGDILASVTGGAGAGDSSADHDRGLIRGLVQAVADCLRVVDLVIGEQTAPDVTRAWAKAAAFSIDRVLIDPGRFGSAFAAASFVALHHAVSQGRLRPGQIALLLSCGSGPAWAVTCLRWGGGRVDEW
jgi:3-oxoacyl-[acyl-carrier-protein] synthase-3